MTGIIGSIFPGASLIPLLIGAAAIAAVSAGGGMVLEHKIDSVTLAHSQTETADAKSALAAYGASVAASSAKASAVAMAQQGELQARLDGLQDQLAQTQKESNARSAHLQALLDAAKPGEIRPLGPASLRYFEQLRSNAAQAAAPNP